MSPGGSRLSDCPAFGKNSRHAPSRDWQLFVSTRAWLGKWRCVHVRIPGTIFRWRNRGGATLISKLASMNTNLEWATTLVGQRGRRCYQRVYYISFFTQCVYSETDHGMIMQLLTCFVCLSYKPGRNLWREKIIAQYILRWKHLKYITSRFQISAKRGRKENEGHKHI